MSSLVEARKKSVEKAEANPSYVTDILDPMQAFFRAQVMKPTVQPVYSAVHEVMSIPVTFDFSEAAYGHYSAKLWDEEAGVLGDEHINISSMFHELLRNPGDYGCSYPVLEAVFVYAHELYHARFRHIHKEAILRKKYPLPHTVYNIVFDIVINTLLKYNGSLLKYINQDINNLLMFKNAIRYYENIKDLEDHMGGVLDLLSELGVEATPEMLGPLQILNHSVIEQLTEDELAEVFYEHFKDFFDNYQECFDQALEEATEAAKENHDNSGFLDDVENRLKEKLKEKIDDNPEFSEAVKSYLANFSQLPPVNVQVNTAMGLKGGVLTPEEMAQAVRGKAAIKDIIESVSEKLAGTIPGWLRSFAEIKPVRPSYLHLLQAFGNKHIGDTRRTYSPPNKKLSREDLLIASKVGSSLSLAFVIDTSGSMSNDEIIPVLGQLQAILRKAPANSKLHVFFNDAAYQHEVIRGRNLTKLRSMLDNGVQGGGGSVFGSVFEHPVMKTVDGIIFLSDFYIFIPDNIRIKRPLILLHTQDYNAEVAKELINRSSASILLPVGKLD